jgi:hypothetical protein
MYWLLHLYVGIQGQEMFSISVYTLSIIIIIISVRNLQVNVTMPAFFFDTDRYLHGTVMANYTSGAPVRGNLTLKATIRPVKPAYRNMDRNPVVEKYFNFVSDIYILSCLV